MIGDTELKVAKLYDMLPGDAGSSSEGRTPADNATVRMVFVIGPDKRIKLTLAYPMSTGRNFDEIIRVLDSICLLYTSPPLRPHRQPLPQAPHGWRLRRVDVSLRNYLEAEQRP